MGEQDFTDRETSIHRWVVSAHSTKEEAEWQSEILTLDAKIRGYLRIHSEVWGAAEHPLVRDPMIDPHFPDGMPSSSYWPTYSVVEIPFGTVFTPPEYPTEEEDGLG
jgi:hypothetical protein